MEEPEMKKLSLFLIAALLITTLAGCAGTTVVVGNCTCPTDAHVAPTQAPTETAAPVETNASAETPAPAAGAVKTGLAIVASLKDSASATAEKDGQAKFDVDFAAVTLDENGVILSCALDSLGATATFDQTGALTSDVNAPLQTKNELGEAYGMKAYAGSQYEWNEQAAALAQYAVGKTMEQLRSGAVDETGHAADADLATTATIYIGGYVAAIEKAAANAQVLGASADDTLKLAIIPSLGKTILPFEGNDGTVQLDCDVAAVTVKDGTITSCYIDSLQAKVNFDAKGTVTSDTSAGAQTKNELGKKYGMKAYAGSQFEWNEQAANFAAYVTGKTADQVAGIAVDEKTAPAEADLASGVTIAIGGLQALIAKALA